MGRQVVIITQARVSSTRLPEKVLKEISGKPMLFYHLSRLKQSNFKVVLATTHEEGAKKIIAIGKDLGIDVFQGSTDDVLDRYYKASVEHRAEYVVRVTSDCPLIDPVLLNEVVNFTINNGVDYGSNILEEQFPDGQDIEVFKFSALEKSWKEATAKPDREHVSLYIRNNSDYKGGKLFKAANFNAPENYNHIRMTVDEQEDFNAIQVLIDNLGPDKSWLEYTHFIVQNLHLFKNQKIIRNEGFLKSQNKK